MQQSHSKITPLEIEHFLGASSNVAPIRSVLEPFGLSAGSRKMSMSETSTASAPFSSNVMMHGQSQAGKSVVEGFCTLYSAK